MATTFKNKNIVQVGTVPVEILSTTGGTKSYYSWFKFDKSY